MPRGAESAPRTIRRVTTSSWLTTREAFAAAATWFICSTPSAHGRWDEPGLPAKSEGEGRADVASDHVAGGWTVRDLVGHTSRALLTVESYLRTETGPIELKSAAAYLRQIAGVADSAAVAQRGRDAGAALGDDPIHEVVRIAARVVARIYVADPDDYVATPFGGMRLIDYLATRTFELVVHTCDLVAALGIESDLPRGAAGEALRLVGAVAAESGRAGPLLLAATGRGGLPRGYSVL